jgi:hypothetical protein
MEAPHPGGLGGTYSGNPLACVAALAALDTITRPAFLAAAPGLGERLRARLLAIQARHPGLVGDVRGLGPMLAMELVRDPVSKAPWMEATQASTPARCSAASSPSARAVLQLRALPAAAQPDRRELDEAMDVLDAAVDAVAPWPSWGRRERRRGACHRRAGSPARRGAGDLIDPATERWSGEVPYGDASDARAALDAAAGRRPAWAAKTAYERGAMLEKAAELIAARAEPTPCGPPRSRASRSGAGPRRVGGRAELPAHGGRGGAVGWAGGGSPRAPGRRIDVTYAPLGVVGVITAWNFPVYNVNRAVSSALAAGCAVSSGPRSHAALGLDYARGPARRRAAAGRAQRRQRRPAQHRAGDARRPALPQDRVHRVDPGRQAADGRRERAR